MTMLTAYTQLNINTDTEMWVPRCAQLNNNSGGLDCPLGKKLDKLIKKCCSVDRTCRPTMNTVVSDLQNALRDKKRLGLFDARLSLKTKSSTLGNTTSIKKKVERSKLLPDADGFSGRHLEPSFFESTKSKRRQSKRERDDELTSADCKQMDDVVNTGDAANDVVCTKRSKQEGKEAPPPITLGLFPASLTVSSPTVAVNTSNTPTR
jgi:hypothetical protein